MENEKDYDLILSTSKLVLEDYKKYSNKKDYKDCSNEQFKIKMEEKYSDFKNDVVKVDKIDTSKMSCDTTNKYSGTPSIKYCGTNEKWGFTGCKDNLPSCKTGKNTDDRGQPYTAGRSAVSNCQENIELSMFDLLDTQANKCDQHYQNNGYFCKLVDDGNNNCTQANQCRP